MEGDWSEKIDAQFQKLSFNAPRDFSRAQGLPSSSLSTPNSTLTSSSLSTPTSTATDPNLTAPPGIPLPPSNNVNNSSVRKISSGSYDSNLSSIAATGLRNNQNQGASQSLGHFRQNSLPTYSNFLGVTGNVDENQASIGSSLTPVSPIGTRTLSSTCSSSSPSPTLSDSHTNIIAAENSFQSKAARNTTGVGLPPMPRSRSTSLASQNNTLPTPNLTSSSDLSSMDRMRSFSADALLAQHTKSLHRRSDSNNSIPSNNHIQTYPSVQQNKSSNITSQSMPNLNNSPSAHQLPPLSTGPVFSSSMNISSHSSSNQTQHNLHSYGHNLNPPVSVPQQAYVTYGNPYEIYPGYPSGYIHYQAPTNNATSHSVMNNPHYSSHVYVQAVPGNGGVPAMASEGDLIRATSGNMSSFAGLASPLIAQNVTSKQIMVYQVKFKRLTKSYLLSQQQGIKVGSYVIVQADRGQDLGMILARTPLDRFKSKEAELKYVIRGATQDEVDLLQEKYAEESVLLKICRSKVKQRKLDMQIIDAEYQYDRHKLTFYFEAEGRVDFRELVRDLFSVYKTRIWMQQVDKNSTPVIQNDE